ncbi:MAG TPA: hypothetical protein VN958_04030, partial [Chitinophagaceae bacterium]|nr:hypothetical protein [Chitinophagaceae bacterium]
MQAYTLAFIRGGLLKADNPIAFSNVNIQQFNLDWNRVKNEIPLIDLKTGEVKYGVHVLVNVLQQKFPLIKRMMKIKFLDWFFRKLYKLASYNRKIIVASAISVEPIVDCTPDCNFFWRWMLIVFCYTVSNVFITTSASLIFTHYKILDSPWLAISWMIIPVLP